MDFDIDSILEAVGLQTDRQAETAAKITGNYETVAAAGNDRALAQATQGENDAIIQGQKATGELKAQQNSKKFATSIGSNMDATSEVMSSLGMQYTDAALEAIKAKDVVIQKSKVQLLDNPIQFIINQLTMGDDINNANLLQDKADLITTTMANINKDTQATAVTQNAIAETKTAATVQATVAMTAAKSKEQEALIKQQNSLYNIQGIVELNKLDQQTLGNMFQARSAVMAEKHLQIAQAQLEEMKFMHRMTVEDRALKIEERKASAADAEELSNTINKGRAGLGLPPIPLTKALQMMKIGGPAGDLIKDQYAQGAVAEATGYNVISGDPGKSAVTIAQTNAPLSPAMAPVRKLLVESLSDVAAGRIKGANGLPIDVKDKNAVISATGEHLKLAAKTQASNIRFGDNNNIYQAPDLNSLSQIPGVAETELYKKVLAPLVATGLTETDPSRILSLASTAVAKGTLDFNSASKGLTVLFSAAAASNNATRDYVRVGLPKQTGYNTSVQIKNANTPESLSFMTSENQKVNLADINSVNSILSRAIRAKTSLQFNTEALPQIWDTVSTGDRTTPLKPLVSRNPVQKAQ